MGLLESDIGAVANAAAAKPPAPSAAATGAKNTATMTSGKGKKGGAPKRRRQVQAKEDLTDPEAEDEVGNTTRDRMRELLEAYDIGDLDFSHNAKKSKDRAISGKTGMMKAENFPHSPQSVKGPGCSLERKSTDSGDLDMVPLALYHNRNVALTANTSPRVSPTKNHTLARGEIPVVCAAYVEEQSNLVVDGKASGSLPSVATKSSPVRLCDSLLKPGKSPLPTPAVSNTAKLSPMAKPDQKPEATQYCPMFSSPPHKRQFEKSYRDNQGLESPETNKVTLKSSDPDDSHHQLTSPEKSHNWLPSRKLKFQPSPCNVNLDSSETETKLGKFTSRGLKKRIGLTDVPCADPKDDEKDDDICSGDSCGDDFDYVPETMKGEKKTPQSSGRGFVYRMKTSRSTTENSFKRQIPCHSHASVSSSPPKAAVLPTKQRSEDDAHQVEQPTLPGTAMPSSRDSSPLETIEITDSQDSSQEEALPEILGFSNSKSSWSSRMREKNEKCFMESDSLPDLDDVSEKQAGTSENIVQTNCASAVCDLTSDASVPKGALLDQIERVTDSDVQKIKAVLPQVSMATIFATPVRFDGDVEAAIFTLLEEPNSGV